MSNAKVAISLRLDTDLHIKVKKESEITGKSMNDIIAQALSEHFNNKPIVEHIDINDPNYKIRLEHYPDYFKAHIYDVRNLEDVFSIKRKPNTLMMRYHAVENMREFIRNQPEIYC